MRAYAVLSCLLSGGCLLCMLAQTRILYLDGLLTLTTGLPLHLCSFACLLSPVMLLRPRGPLRPFYTTLALPGALLAALFPQIMPTSRPDLTYASFMGMHLTLAALSLLPGMLGIGCDSSPAKAMLAPLVLLAAATAADLLFDANYLFLARPLPETPLRILLPLSLPARAGAYLALCALLTGLYCDRKRRFK